MTTREALVALADVAKRQQATIERLEREVARLSEQVWLLQSQQG